MPQRFYVDGRWITADQYTALKAEKENIEASVEPENTIVEPEPLTAKQIKTQLTELGVKFKGNAKKEDLQALLDKTIAEEEAEIVASNETGEVPETNE